MEKLDINYSLNNIPIPSNNSYLVKLIEKIRKTNVFERKFSL